MSTTLEMVPKLLRMVVGRIGGTKINRWACSLTKCNFIITIINLLQTSAGVHRARTWADTVEDRLGPDDLFISADTDEVWKCIAMKLGQRYR